MGGALPSSYLLDAKIAAYAVAPEPAWLWKADGTRVLWTNATGAAVFGALTAAALTLRTFEASDRTALQVARMAETLTHDGAARLERFTGFGSALLRPVTCICSRVTLKDAPPAILICGVEPLRPPLPLIDRLQRLLVDEDQAIAAFTASGELLFATASARARLPSPATLEDLTATELAAHAVSQGASGGPVMIHSTVGDARLWRVGRAGEVLLMLHFEDASRTAEIKATDPKAVDTCAIDTSTTDACTIDTGVAKPVSETEVTPPQMVKESPAEELSSTQQLAAAVVAAAVPAKKQDAATTSRRHPLRFVWRMDPGQHFTLVSDEFLGVASSATTLHNGEPWPEFRALLGLDPLDSVTEAIATRDTWSGIVLSWPTHEGDHITVELAGLPIFDRQREFVGYRGFGVCRDTAHLDRLIHRDRAEEDDPSPVEAAGEPGVLEPDPLESDLLESDFLEQPATPMPPPAPLPSIIPVAANVVPFPAAAPPPPGFSAGDRKAFSDIAQQLAARLKGSGMKADVASAPPPLQTADVSSRIDGRVDGRTDTVDGALAAGGRSLAHHDERALLSCLPFGVLIYRAQELLFANRAFLDRVGHHSLEAFAEDGGLDNLLLAPGPDPRNDPSARKLTVQTPSGGVDVDTWLISVPFDGESAYALILDNPQRPTSARASIRDNGHDRALDKIFEQQLTEARRRADQAAAAHAALLGELSRDIRTPLTAIVGFAEAILSERFGPIGNERYRDYLSGIHNAGTRILTVIEHLGDIGLASPAAEPQEAETVRVNAVVDLNQVVKTCVSELQADAVRNRVLIRISLTQPLPSVAADAKAVRQIVQNLMTNSIKLAGAGGQVIVSTGVSAAGMVSLRLRDTGMGLNENELAASLQPTEAMAADDGAEGRLKIAVAKALAEANRASLTVSSRPNDGTLVEVSFSEVSAPAA